ncbi:hypothetical protein TMUPMC115_2174 [Tetragenococcus muriaticus PMC-11-5]|uniref:DUF3169 family protein n=1 Tax=Tetragenococcus muriaticus PMC-11-5 TaxID=1302649 RepID=A0A091BZ01_9ENTE|nr:hypothetical protein TMUPMC115_2174 [Tetragenococcus muriaticus PMC-11-5]
MKRTVKTIWYLIIGAAVGLLISTTAQSIGGDVSTSRFYMWVSVISATVAAFLVILGFFQYRRLLTISKDYTKYMDEDSYDKYRYNKHNEIQIYSIVGFVLSLISLSIPLITYYRLAVVFILIYHLYHFASISYKVSKTCKYTLSRTKLASTIR